VKKNSRNWLLGSTASTIRKKGKLSNDGQVLSHQNHTADVRRDGARGWEKLRNFCES
jgi:hypothetical protein